MDANGHAFMALRDEELKLACIRTYNDYQAEFASPAPERFIVGEAVMRKILYDNAARVYHLSS